MAILIVMLIVAFIINRLYHKIFHVTYFGFMSLIFEWFVCLIISGIVVDSLLKRIFIKVAVYL